MVSPRAYIRKVNTAVRNGTHDRPIVVKRQNFTPSSGKHMGLAMTYHWKNKDEIIIPMGVPKTRAAANKFERTENGKFIKKQFGLRKLPTEDEMIRHELYHIHKPKSKEAAIVRADNNPLPARLPPKRTSGFDKHR